MKINYSNGQFGNGSSIFPASNLANEGGSGVVSYDIRTSVSITFKARVFATGRGTTLGNTGVNRFPTIEIQEI
jgi:hypothetical protein